MKKRYDYLIITLSVIVICINIISLTKKNYAVSGNINTEIGKAIIELEKDEPIKQEISETLLPIEYNFTVRNYKEDNVNEINYEYIIQIEVSDNKFPVKCKLWDCDNNKFIDLTEGKSEKLQLRKNQKEDRKFKILFEWKELNEEFAENVQIKLKVDSVQKIEGGINEN